METSTIIKLVCFYVLVAAGEVLNGIFRTLYLNKRVGVVNAKRISMVSALSLCLFICYFYLPLFPFRADMELLYLGISLSSFMLMFDLVMGRFILKARWKTILDDFNIFRGNLLAAGLVLMAFCPLLAVRLRDVL